METAVLETGPKIARTGKFAMLSRPALEVVRTPGAAREPIPADDVPPEGLRFYVRRGMGTGWHDAADGAPEVRSRGAKIMQTIVYAQWLDGATKEKISRDLDISRLKVDHLLAQARRRLTTLKVVHDAIARLDRVGIPLAVDAILKSLGNGDVDTAFKVLGGRQVLVKSSVSGDEPTRGTDPTGVNLTGLTINILPANSAKPVTLGTVVGQPLTGAPPVIDGEVAR